MSTVSKASGAFVKQHMWLEKKAETLNIGFSDIKGGISLLQTCRGKLKPFKILQCRSWRKTSFSLVH